MTYLQFHFVFILPPIALLAWLLWCRRGHTPFHLRHALIALGVLCVVAFSYTTPWDNYLLANQVWGYGDGKVLFTIGYVPIEEYLFFLLQTILTGLWFLYLYSFRALPLVSEIRMIKPGWQLLWGLLWLAIAALGVLALRHQHSLYLGLILAWAAPIVAIQCAFGADMLRQQRHLIAAAIAVPTLYLWLADRIAIGLHIWWISDTKTTGVHLVGLPIEEALFFAMTNILVVFGLALALHPQAMPRLHRFIAVVRRYLIGNPWRACLGLWVLAMIPTPLLPDYFLPLSYLSTSALALALLGFAWQRYGANKALKLCGCALGFGWFVEWVGKSTGFPFGSYSYADTPLQLLGVPLLVPLGWWAFTMIALAMTPERWGRGAKLLFAPLVLVAWDSGLDPLMVHKGVWHFAHGAYYGVPWSNFVGWYGAGLVLVMVLSRLEPSLLALQAIELRLIFYLQLFLLTIGLLFFGLYGAALTFFLSMATLGIIARLASR